MAFPFAAAGSLLSAGLGMMSAKKAAKDQKKAQQVVLSNAGQAYTPINVFGPGGSGVTFGQGGSAYDPAGLYGFQLGGYQPQAQTFTGVPTTPQPAGSGEASGTPIPGTPYFSDGKGGMVTESGLEVVEGTRGRVKRTNIDQANVSAGDLDPLRQSQTGLATLLGQNMGLDAETQALLGNYQDAAGLFGDAGLQGLGQLQAGAQFGAGLGIQGMADASDFAGALRQQASDAFAALPGTQEAATQAAYQRMTELAQPGIDRSIAEHDNRQFARGQMGTSGGALQTEAFARGLGQADTARQLAAMQEGRSALNAQLGLGTGLASQQDASLANAMKRFTGMADMSNQLGQTRYDRTSDIANTNFKRAGELLANAPQAVQQAMISSQLGNIGGALGNIGGINENALSMANFAQMLMNQQAGARNQTVAPTMQMAQNAGAGNMAQSGMFNQLAGALSQQAGPGGAFGAIGDWLGGMRNNAVPSAPSTGGYTAPSIMPSGGMDSQGFMPNPWG